MRIRIFGFVLVLLLTSCNIAEAATSNNEDPIVPTQNPVKIQALTLPFVTTTTSVGDSYLLYPTASGGIIASATPEGIRTPFLLPAQPTTKIETPTPEFIVCSPLAGVELGYLTKIISDPYRPPPPRSDDRHEGVDFSYYNLDGKRTFIAGVGIKSVLPGIVAASISDSFPYGNFVIIETPREWMPVAMQHRLEIPKGSSLFLLYAHMQSAPVVAMGEVVDSCQLVGKVGKTGNSAVAHLHLEARRGPAGATFESMAAFQPTIKPEERANYKLWRTSGKFVHFDPMLVFQLQ